MKLVFISVCVCVALLTRNAMAKPSVPGGFNALDVKSPNIDRLANIALSSITQQSTSKRSLGLAKVVSAESQVVSGVNYKIGLHVCEKDSDNGDQLDRQNCRLCRVTIWEQQWLNKTSVTDVTCSKPDKLELLSSSLVNNEIVM